MNSRKQKRHINERSWYGLFYGEEPRDKNNIKKINMIPTNVNQCNVCSDGKSVYTRSLFYPGDIINVIGKFEKPEEAKNYGGFNYRNYLKQQKIYGIIKFSDPHFEIFGFLSKEIKAFNSHDDLYVGKFLPIYFLIFCGV